MPELCPKCQCYSLEFDPHQKVERCLNWHCGWVNRDRIPIPEQGVRSFKFSRTMEKRVQSNSKTVPEGHPTKEEVGA